MLSSKTHKLLEKFFDDFEWIHISLGLAGNFLFFVGSIMFFSDNWQHAGTWLFVIGSLLMLIGSLGEALRRYNERKKT